MKPFSTSSLLLATVLLVGTELQVAFAQQFQCFENNTELRQAIVSYAADNSSASQVAQTYGYPMADWCVDKVTNFSYVFYDVSLNEPLTNWNTSSAITMEGMFAEAFLFNQPLDSFETSKVTNFGMFMNGAFAFNASIASFDTSSARSMSWMFFDAKSFDQSVSHFDTSKVEIFDSMFFAAESFNQPVPFNTSSAVTMFGMFSSASNFNQPVNFDTSKVTSLANMFSDATSFNQSIDFVGSSLENAQGMFDGAAKFRQNLCSWGADIVAASPDGRNVVLDIMFDGTDCPDINEGFVDTYANPPGPFCFPCSTSSSSALLSAMKSWLALSVVGALAVAM